MKLLIILFALSLATGLEAPRERPSPANLVPILRDCLKEF